MDSFDIPMNEYFEYGNREISINEFEDVLYDITYENDNVINIINMLIGSIYYGNYLSCRTIIDYYDFNQFIYNENFEDLLRQTIYQLQYLIDDEDQEAINTHNLVYETFPYLHDNIRRENNFIDNSDDESDTESNGSEIIATGYDSP